MISNLITFLRHDIAFRTAPRGSAERDAADIDGLDEVAELLEGLPAEDTATVGRWIEAMREPAYWSKDIARLTAELEQDRRRVQELEQSLSEASERRWSLTP